MSQTAYVDESFHEDDVDGFYVLAAVVFGANAEQARDSMLALRGRRRLDKLHWHEMGDNVQFRAVDAVRSVGGMYIATVGAPVRRKGQERARRISLRRLVFELHSVGVTQIYVEARQDLLNRRDVQLVRDARFDLPKGAELRVDHRPGAEDPLFWIADIVAGAVRADREGRGGFRAVLAGQLDVVEVDCS